MDAQLKSFLEREREQRLGELKSFIRIPSISSSTEHKDDMRKAAEWLADSMRNAGLENVEILPTAGHPVVYGDWLHAPGKPTALVYGHYDVQPVDPIEEWDTPPFEPVVKDGKLYARGATDDKGQLFTQVKTVEAFLKTFGKLPVNIKFCIEGEEEISSPNMKPFIEANAERLKADTIVISDGPMHGKGVPSICYGLRGIAAFRIDVKGPRNDLHSGLYGGGVANPIHALSELLASFHDTQDKVAVEGFYDRVHTMTEQEHEAFRKLAVDENKIKAELQVSELYGEQGYTFVERTSARPTLEIVSVAGGFLGEGLKPAVPSSAYAKIACRLVDDQEPDEIMDLIERHLERHRQAGVEVTMTRTHRGKPFLISPEHPYIKAAAEGYIEGFGKDPVYIRSGGSIPIIEAFSRILGTPVVMMDFGFPEDNMHGPNEHFHLDSFERGIASLCRFYEELGQLS